MFDKVIHIITASNVSKYGFFSGPYYPVFSPQIHKYGVFSGPYFPVFIPNTGKYGPEKTLYLDTFHTVHGHKFMTFWSWT